MVMPVRFGATRVFVLNPWPLGRYSMQRSIYRRSAGGAIITVLHPTALGAALTDTTPPLDILFQDEHFVAVNKPRGLLVHRSAIDRRETRFAMQMVRDQIGRRVYPVHRIDKPTSGVLLFAFNPEAARSLMEVFQGHKVRKTYLAVVRGHTQEQGRIDYPLREEPDRMTDRRARQGKEAQPAVTDYRRLATVELPFPVGRYASSRYSLVAVTPFTGRRHQIRRHMKHIFHPVVGDTTHGDGRHNRFFREQFDCHRLLLSAVELSFVHPYTGEGLTVSAPLDAGFQTIIERFGWCVG